MNQATKTLSRLWGGAIGGIVVAKPEDIRQLLRSTDLWAEKRSACQTARAWVGADKLESGIPASVGKVLSGASEWSSATVTAAIFECPTELDTATAPSMSDVMVVCRLPGGPGVIAVEGKAGESFDLLVRTWLRRAEAGSGKPARLQWACDLLGIDRAACEDLRWQLFHRTASAILQARRFEARHAVMMVHDFTCDPLRDHFDDYERFAGRLGFSVSPNTVSEAREIGGVSLRLAWVSDTLQPA